MFKLTTPNGGIFEIDPTKVEGFVFELGDQKYELTLKQL